MIACGSFSRRNVIHASLRAQALDRSSKSRPGPVERARRDDVADARAGPFVAVLAREVRPGEPADALPSASARRRRARARRDGDARDDGRRDRGCGRDTARLDRSSSTASRACCSRRAARSRRPRARSARSAAALSARISIVAAVEAGQCARDRCRPRPRSPGSRLAWTAIGSPPRPARAFSGTSCTGFQPVGSAGRGRRAALVHPRRVRGRRDVHVVNGEDLDRPVDVVRRIGSGRPIGDAVATRAELGQPQRERDDATIVGLDDHLKRDDLIARARDMDHMSVPRRIVAPAGWFLASRSIFSPSLTAQTRRTPASASIASRAIATARAISVTWRPTPPALSRCAMASDLQSGAVWVIFCPRGRPTRRSSRFAPAHATGCDRDKGTHA